MQRVSVAEFRPVQKNTLLGFFTLNYGSLAVRDCSYHLKDGRDWFSFPARKVEKADGTSSWVAFVVVDDRAHLDKLREHVCGLLRPLAGVPDPAAETSPAESVPLF